MTKSQNTKNEQQKDLCITSEQQVWKYPLSRALELQEQNAQLKELLKECKKMLMQSNYQNMTQYHEVLDIRDKINKIIGEK